MFPRSQVRAFILLGLWATVTRVSAVIFLGVWFLMQLFNGVASIGYTAQSGGVAVWAHIGGVVFGMMAGFLFKGKASRLQFHWP
jgi:membrane associated rhomboid family serine protease